MEEKSFTVRFELEVTAASEDEAKGYALDDLAELRKGGTLEGEIVTGPKPITVRTAGGQMKASQTTDPIYPGILIELPNDKEVLVEYNEDNESFTVHQWDGKQEDPVHTNRL